MRKRENVVGNRYGRLIVIEDAEPYIWRGKKNRMEKCLCDCGNIVFCQLSALKCGLTKSCGCYMREMVSKTTAKTNNYDFYDGYVVGHCSNCDDVFYVDIEDYEKIKNYCWLKHKTNGYIISNTYKINGKKKEIKLHRLIMDAKDGDIIDHINGQKTDNRKSNLRFCNAYQNGMNSTNKTKNISGQKGVYYIKRDDSWLADISVNGKRIRLGQRKNLKEAIKLRKDAEEKYYGEFRRKEQENDSVISNP